VKINAWEHALQNSKSNTHFPHSSLAKDEEEAAMSFINGCLYLIDLQNFFSP
jgi:hypothetical protein